MTTENYQRPIESADQATADEVVWTHHDGSLFAGPKAWVDELLHRPDLPKGCRPLSDMPKGADR